MPDDADPPILAFPGLTSSDRPTAKPIRRKDEKAKACKHLPMLVDLEKRVIECAECGAVVDPFDAIVKWVDYDYTLDARLQAIRDYEAKEAERERRRREREKNRKG